MSKSQRLGVVLISYDQQTSLDVLGKSHAEFTQSGKGTPYLFNIYVFKSISSRSKQFNTMFFHLLGGYNKKHKAVILVPTALMKEYLSTTPKHMNIFI